MRLSGSLDGVSFMDFQPVGCCDGPPAGCAGGGRPGRADPGIDPLRRPEFYRIGD